MLEMSDSVEPVQPAATVVMVRDGAAGLEVLLVQRNKAVQHMGGMWVFPGGKVDKADYPPDGDAYTAALNAAIRETQEEAGVDVAPDQLVYLSHWTTPEGAKRRFSTWFFLTILRDDQEVIVDGGEIANHRWVQPQVAFAELADETHPFRLATSPARGYLNSSFNETPTSRAQEGAPNDDLITDLRFRPGLLDVAGVLHRDRGEVEAGDRQLS